MNKSLALLDHKGDIQMTFNQGAIVFSIPDTKKIIKHAQQSDSDSISDMKILGQLFVDIRTKQLKTKPQYVNA